MEAGQKSSALLRSGLRGRGPLQKAAPTTAWRRETAANVRIVEEKGGSFLLLACRETKSCFSAPEYREFTKSRIGLVGV